MTENFPSTRPAALRHIGITESGRTPLVNLFGVGDGGGHIKTIRKMYRRLALLVHPDRAKEGSDRRNAARIMRTFARGLELAEVEVQFDAIVNQREPDANYVISDDIVYMSGDTEKEVIVRQHEREEQRRKEQAEEERKARAAEVARQTRTSEAGEARHRNEDNEGREGCEAEEARREHCASHGSKQQDKEQEKEKFRSREGDVDDAEQPKSRSCYDSAEKRNKSDGPNSSSSSSSSNEEEDLVGSDEDARGGYPNWEGNREYYDEEEDEDETAGDFNMGMYIADCRLNDINEDAGGAGLGIESQGATPTSDHEASPRTRKKNKRAEQKRASKRRAKQRAKAALWAERIGAMTWRPRRCGQIEPKTGIALDARWKCDQYIRAYNAFMAVQNGVNIIQTLDKVSMKCRTTGCTAAIVFDRQIRSGLWKLNKYIEHGNECRGQEVPSISSCAPQKKSRYCTPAYTAEQVARAILEDTGTEPNINCRTIAAIVKAKQIYRTEPSYSHYRAIRRELLRHMSTSRTVDMAALDGYAELLRKMGHTVRIIILNGVEMKETRVKAARHIFEQCRKAKSIPSDAHFNPDVVSLTDIDDDGRYYGGFIFVPSVAKHYCTTARTTCAAEASHCDGVGPQSFGTTFEVVGYDTNNHLLPLVFAHSVGPECFEAWRMVFEACKGLPGFDHAKRTTIVDQEKSIDRAYRETFEHAHLFLDPVHVKKNMGAKLGAEKAVGIGLYERAVYAPTKEAVEMVRSQYGPIQRAYLARFQDEELYRAFSVLEDPIKTTFQGAESQIAEALRNHIRAVEPQKMLTTVVLTQRTGFLQRQAASSACNSPVPPCVGKQSAYLIQRSRIYQPTVSFVDGTAQMEASVYSHSNGSIKRRVVLSKDPQTPPSCCAYSKSSSGFPCWHGVAVLCEKYGSSNIHRFIDERHLTTAWKKQYENVCFPLPDQSDVDEVLLNAKRMVASGRNLQIPKALPPPRGRLVKNAGKRRKGWCERGASAKKRRKSYSFSLCHEEGHIARECVLRQLFEET